ncbi:MAG: SDR family NAD(P)-dependent oxidoreductase, partial [Burkholderiales bacterium]
MQLNQVKAIITGGASGLGLAVARQLVASGGKVTLFDVNDANGQAAARELGDAARFLRTDVTSEDGVATNAAAAHHAMGGLNLVMNCAGTLGAGRVLGKQGAMPLANFSSTVMVNLVGSFNVAKAGA